MYNWYQPTLHQNVFDTATYKYHKGDINAAVTVVARFEENVKNAKVALETATDQSMFENWKKLIGGDKPVFSEMTRI